jgi:hypothetical protein
MIGKEVNTVKIKRILSVLCALFVLLLVGCMEGTGNVETIEQLTPGSIVEIASSADVIICATTQENYKQVNKYIAADDKTGAENMLNRGQIFLLKTGTNVKVIQITFNGIEVRVQEGEYKDEIAWIQSDFLKY